MRLLLVLSLFLTSVAFAESADQLTAKDLVPLFEKNELTDEKLEEIIQNSKSEEDKFTLNFFASLTVVSAADGESKYHQLLEQGVPEEAAKYFKEDYQQELKRIKLLNSYGVYANLLGGPTPSENLMVRDTPLSIILNDDGLKCAYETVSTLYHSGEDNNAPAMIKMIDGLEVSVSRKDLLAEAYKKTFTNSREACKKAAKIDPEINDGKSKDVSVLDAETIKYIEENERTWYHASRIGSGSTDS